MKLEDIQPITALKRRAAELIERAREKRSPVIITQNGTATAVLQDVASFEEERQAFALLKLAMLGERDIVDGRSKTLAQHRAEMKSILGELEDEDE